MQELVAYLAETGKTQADLAREADLSKSYVSEICSGARRPSYAVMLKIRAWSDGAVTLDSWAPGETRCA